MGETDLQTELNSSVGSGKTTVSSNGDETLNVNFTDTKHNYTVNGGTVTRTADGDVNEDLVKLNQFFANGDSIDGENRFLDNEPITDASSSIEWVEINYGISPYIKYNNKIYKFIYDGTSVDWTKVKLASNTDLQLIDILTNIENMYQVAGFKIENEDVDFFITTNYNNKYYKFTFDYSIDFTLEVLEEEIITATDIEILAMCFQNVDFYTLYDSENNLFRSDEFFDENIATNITYIKTEVDTNDSNIYYFYIEYNGQRYKITSLRSYFNEEYSYVCNNINKEN